MSKTHDGLEISRYILNGLFATGVHYGVLNFNIQIVEIGSAGIANLIAAVFGISSSFLGSRYFVFQTQRDSMIHQALKFGLLYLSIAMLHGLVLFIWTDNYGFSYRVGFLLATGLQVVLSYFGNKFLVFNA